MDLAMLLGGFAASAALTVGRSAISSSVAGAREDFTLSKLEWRSVWSHAVKKIIQTGKLPAKQDPGWLRWRLD
jgi:hypothetical protein